MEDNLPEGFSVFAFPESHRRLLRTSNGLERVNMTAPANKLFPFGGDYMSVETIYGHSQIARQGVAQALAELVEEGWLAQEETPELIERLLSGNAHEIFGEGKQANG